MNMRFTRKQISIGLALGGALSLLVFWILHPAVGNPDVPELPATSMSPIDEARREEGVSRDSSGLPRQGTASPPATAARPIGTPADSPTPSTAGPRGGQWGHLRFLNGIAAGLGEAGCKEAIRRTAAYLSIDAVRMSEFEVAARQSVLDMEQALKDRKRELSASSPGEGSSVLSDQERRSQERYAAARRKALDRLEKFLALGPVHQDFRWAFDSWASMVATKTRGEER